MTLLEKLADGQILLCDGGMGTSLQEASGGVDCPERLNLERPNIVEAAHRAFYEAGSDLVETNTFGGTRTMLKMHGLEDRAAEISRRAAEIARSACPDACYVLGSIGPSGQILEPFGDADPDALSDVFAEQTSALAEGGVDAIVVETMMDGAEARLAIETAKATTGLPVIGTMTFAVGPAGVRTRWGIDPESAVQLLEDAGADVVGSNCGNGFDEMYRVIEKMRPVANRPVIAQANAGVPEMVGGRPVYRETPEEVGPKAARLLELGVAILGGCCGTGPEHIRVMRELIDGKND